MNRRIFLMLAAAAAAIGLVLAALPLHAAERGIRVTTVKGQTLPLYTDYHALVIGVSDYKKGWPDLPGAEKDARDVAGALKKAGFTVDLVLDPDSRQLKQALTKLAFVTGKNADRAILLYFAGHGDTINLADGTELGYLVPADCPLYRDDPMGFDDLAVSMKQIESLALKIHSRHLLMMFDSCFSGSIFSLVRAAPTDITEKSAKPVRQFITAGGPGEQVPDRSMFKIVFVDGIGGEADLNSDGYVTGSELGMHLQDKVVNYTRGGQHPQYGKINNPRLDKGDFVFALAGPGKGAVPPPAIAEPPRGGSLGNYDQVIAERAATRKKWQDWQAQMTDAFTKAETWDRSGNLTGAEKADAWERFGGSYAADNPFSREDEALRAKALGRRDHWRSAAGNAGPVTLAMGTRPAAGQRQNDIGMTFAPIPAGSFTMGSPAGEPGRADDKKQHRVTLSRGFYLQTTEVTVGQWRAFVQDAGFKTEAETSGGAFVWDGKKWEKKAGTYWDNPGFSQSDTHPVTCVSWNDVQAFIKWINAKGEGKYRQPTEAEWEYAARAGSTTAFSNGGITNGEKNCNRDPNLDVMGWYCGNSGGKTHPTAAKQPNAWGLYDMHGNVWEWVQDRYGDYPTGAVTDPTGPSGGADRVYRGGGWHNYARGCRSANRNGVDPGRGVSCLGFRLAMDQ